MEGKHIVSGLRLLLQHRQAHEAPVARVSWAHPEFGPILASCSFDRTTKIWEQAPSSVELDPQPGGAVAAGGGGGAQPVSRWIQRSVMTESKGTMRDVAFAPHYFGLKLVCRLSFDYVRSS